MPKNQGLVRRDFLKLSTGVVAAAVFGSTRARASSSRSLNQSPHLRASGTPVASAQYVSVKSYGAAGDGVTDDTAAIQNANNAAASANQILYFPAGTYLVSKTLQQTATWEGQYGGQVDNSDNPAMLMKANGTTNGAAVVQVSASNISCRYLSCIVPNPPSYDRVSYPTGSAYANNPSYGFYIPDGTSSQAVLFYGCSASGFSVAGFYLGLGAIVCQIQFCDARWCTSGINVASTDCQVMNCTVRYNCGQGVVVSATYVRLLNNTIAWNSCEGMYVTGGEFVVNNNVFDRNGKAGLYVGSGWGGVVSANSFSRNGASGNGTSGRWGTSTPGTESYALISASDSCHIQVFYQRDVAITGNTYLAGVSDTGDGSFSPAYVYSNAGANGNIVVGNNSGEGAYSNGSGGYNPNYPGGSGTYSGGSF
jgi:hypothetical protein